MRILLLPIVMLVLSFGAPQHAAAFDTCLQPHTGCYDHYEQQGEETPNGKSPKTVVITLGTQVVQSSNTTGHSPYSYTWESRRIQFVYTAAEILAAGGATGSITAIAWDVAQVNEGDLRNYEIKMAHTTATDAASHNAAVLTQVKNAHTLAPGNVGWYTIPFDSPFAWNGTDNLLVDVCWGVNTGFTLTGRVWLYNNVPNQKITEHSSTANQCGNTTTLRSNGKPRAQLTITPTPSIDPSLVSITSPASPIWSFNAGLLPVTVHLRNGGTSSLTAAQIVWAINGVNQVPFAWQGSLSHNAVAEVTLGTFDFSAVGTYLVSATVEVAGDQVATNNTVTRTVVVAAPFGIPYAENFDATAAPELPPLWSVANVNGDNIQWVTSSTNPYSGENSASIGYNLLMGMNDWLFSPKISLEAGKAYRASFFYRAHASTHPEKLKLHWGTEAAVVAMSAQPLVNLPSITNTTYAEAQTTIVPASTGTYHLGFHGYSAANQWALYIDNVTIDLVRHTVTFNVVDANSNPIADAVVTFNGVAAAAGQYVFTNVAPGTYAYSVAKPGYFAATGNVTVTSANVTENVTLLLNTSVNTGTFANFSTYPNPFSSQISISNPAVVSRVVVANLIGQVVMDVRTNGVATVETANLSAGVYLVTFEAANGERLVRKMVKK